MVSGIIGGCLKMLIDDLLNASKSSSPAPLLYVLISVLLVVPAISIAADKATKQYSAATTTESIAARVQQLTASLSRSPEYTNDVKRLQGLARQLDIITADIDRLEKTAPAQGRTAIRDRNLKQLLARLARQRADAQAIAKKEQERTKAVEKTAADDAAQSRQEAREQFRLALRIINERQERASQVLRKLTN